MPIDISPALPEGLRVPIALVEGPTPAQVALRQQVVTPSAVPPCEERLYRVFELLERVLHPDVSGRYGALLQDIAEDQTYDGVTYLGLIRAPASAVAPWFAEEGGLIRHVLRQWQIWEDLRGGGKSLAFSSDPLPAEWLADPDVTDANVLQGILHNALPGGWAHFVRTPEPEWSVTVGAHESTVTLVSAAKAIFLLQQAGILLDGHLLHLLLPNLLRHEGYSSPLARVVTQLDSLSMLHPEPVE